MPSDDWIMPVQRVDYAVHLRKGLRGRKLFRSPQNKVLYGRCFEWVVATDKHPFRSGDTPKTVLYELLRDESTGILTRSPHKLQSDILAVSPAQSVWD